MEYNSTRNRLIIPEYGRNVQKLVEMAIAMENKDERTQLAHYIVQIMMNFNSSEGIFDSEQKVWDHLYIISDFKLDVDSPYPMPDKDKITAKPTPVPYSNSQIRFRTYGKITENIIKKALEMEDGEEKQALITLIAFNLKRAYLTWNRTSVDDEQLKDDLYRMSGGKLTLPEGFEFPSTQDILGKKKPKEKMNPQRNQKPRPKLQQKPTNKPYNRKNSY